MAEAKGLSQRRIMFRYAARNALLPNVTAFGMALGFVVSGALLTEIVFSYPGLGYQLIMAVRNLDYPLMQGIFLMITFAVLAANLIVDMLYVRLDPRVRRRSRPAGRRGESERRSRSRRIEPPVPVDDRRRSGSRSDADAPDPQAEPAILARSVSAQPQGDGRRWSSCSSSASLALFAP